MGDGKAVALNVHPAQTVVDGLYAAEVKDAAGERILAVCRCDVLLAPTCRLHICQICKRTGGTEETVDSIEVSS